MFLHQLPTSEYVDLFYTFPEDETDSRDPQDMKLPKPLLDYLKKKKIEAPTPIQLQGIPVACVGFRVFIRVSTY
jgi:superfamily II DNA/RNA helicase